MSTKRSPARKRLEDWGQWVQNPRSVQAGTYSVFGKIADERNAAGDRGEGIRYEIIDGVSCPPDGGLAREMEIKARAWGFDFRCRETHAAIDLLPAQMRLAIREMYAVPSREEPRTIRAVSVRMNRDYKTIHESITTAHQKIERELFGPFEVLPDADDEVDEAA